MTQTTITVQEATLDRFRELKRDHNAQTRGPELTNDLFLQALMDTWADDATAYHANDVDEMALASAVIDELEREHKKTQELAEQARDAAQRVEEGMGR